MDVGEGVEEAEDVELELGGEGGEGHRSSG